MASGSCGKHEQKASVSSASGLFQVIPKLSQILPWKQGKYEFIHLFYRVTVKQPTKINTREYFFQAKWTISSLFLFECQPSLFVEIKITTIKLPISEHLP